MQVARDYLAEWTPQELGILPESCQAPALRDANDVAAYAFALMQEECKVYERGCELLGMSAFFAAASTRLSIILAHAKGDPIRLFVTQ